MTPCVFCEIIAHRVPSWPVDESAGAVAFLTIQPLTDGHTLVVPRSHAETVDEMSAGEWAYLWALVRRVAQRLRSAGLADGMNLMVASGRAAEQSVMHLHVHVIPRTAGDGVEMNAWLDPKVHPAVPDRQAEIARRLAGALPP